MNVSSCYFGESFAITTFINRTTISCISPAFSNATVVNLQVRQNLGNFSLCDQKFTFFNETTISISSPKVFGNHTKGIYINGLFQNFSTLGCRYGDITISGTYINETSVWCLVAENAQKSDGMTLEVTNNGQQFSNKLALNFIKVAMLAQIYPRKAGCL